MKKTERKGKSYKNPKKMRFQRIEKERALIKAGECQGTLYFDWEEIT